MKSLRIRNATMVTAAVMSLTASSIARADTTPDTPALAPTGTPLQTRQTRPLETLTTTTTGQSTTWPLAALVLLGGVGYWVIRTRTAPRVHENLRSIDILQRAAIGVRSELLLVEVDGQRILLGVTPTSVQSLYIPSPLEPDAPVVNPPAPEPARPALAGLELSELRITDTVKRPIVHASPAKRPARAPAAEFVEEQAKGLYAFAERR